MRACIHAAPTLRADKPTQQQLDMELTGDFTFDSPHHYSATVRTKAQMGGMTMVDSRNTLEGQWVSECPPQ
jgi:hypothetical protein